ncbi:hypothetical protein MKW94_005335 [Papaver nudicaule]|uniref:Cytochrome P450 n=1 Tax=Papaver nudicaule TaxID=74823 RepID=A0AA42AW33_PAPNU|nr:hypothetical protein [Papaver nudicaule]
MKLILFQPITVSFSTFPFTATIISIIFLYNVFLIVTKEKKKKAPNASGAWPLLGHLGLFMKDKPIYKTLGTMADTYGPAFNIQLGSQEYLVVSNKEMVKECFTSNDKLFSNRSITLGAKYMLNHTSTVVFSPYGTYWREVRKIMMQQVLSNRRLQELQHSKIDEIDKSFAKLNDLCSKDANGTKVSMEEWLEDMTFNISARIVFGYQSGGDTPDFFPYLEFVDRLTGLVKNMKNLGDELNSIAGCFIQEHRQKRRAESLSSPSSLSNEVDGDVQDFFDVLMPLMEQSRLHLDDPDLLIKTTILEPFAFWTESSTASLTWVISLLLNHPNVLKQAREEIDRHVENGKQVEASDIPKLAYMNAIIKESMRLYPFGAVLERYTTEDCEVGGFNVAAGTHVIVNVWKIHRDPSVWENPSEFRPERFLSSDKVGVDLYGQSNEFLPFGTGRRMCPGINLALQMMHYVLARLVQGYELKPASPDGKVDMEEKIVITNIKMCPLEAIISLRR